MNRPLQPKPSHADDALTLPPSVSVPLGSVGMSGHYQTMHSSQESIVVPPAIIDLTITQDDEPMPTTSPCTLTPNEVTVEVTFNQTDDLSDVEEQVSSLNKDQAMVD
ncbi:hypothetical protein A0J61_10763, partial [Choanephora cucurbitarum]